MKTREAVAWATTIDETRSMRPSLALLAWWPFDLASSV